MHNLVASILISWEENPNHIIIAVASPHTECANTVAINMIQIHPKKISIHVKLLFCQLPFEIFWFGATQQICFTAGPIYISTVVALLLMAG